MPWNMAFSCAALPLPPSSKTFAAQQDPVDLLFHIVDDRERADHRGQTAGSSHLAAVYNRHSWPARQHSCSTWGGTFLLPAVWHSEVRIYTCSSDPPGCLEKLDALVWRSWCELRGVPC